MRRCPRCGDAFDLYRLVQRRCRRCQSEVQLLVESDTRRRAPRFRLAHDLTGWIAA